MSEVACVASLAHQGLVNSEMAHQLDLRDLDLTSVPTKHLSSLFSIVRDEVHITNISGCDLVTILDSIRSHELFVMNQNLTSEETQALVRAMESCVERVTLYWAVFLDISDLMEYSGLGKCRVISLWGESGTRYRERLSVWAKSRNWNVSWGYDDCYFKRKK